MRRDREAALHQALHDRAVGQIDANGEASGAAPVVSISQAASAAIARHLAHRTFPANHATIIDRAGLMNLARPVDADIPSNSHHGGLQPGAPLRTLALARR